MMSFQLSPLFGDRMVLPAGKTVRVFGSGDPRGLSADAGWIGVQAAQKKAVETVPGTALVVSRDVCESNDIHPVTKSRLAERLAKTIVLLVK